MARRRSGSRVWPSSSSARRVMPPPAVSKTGTPQPWVARGTFMRSKVRLRARLAAPGPVTSTAKGMGVPGGIPQLAAEAI